MFRLFFTPGQKHVLFKDNDKSLAMYVGKSNGIDCYHSLNVYINIDFDVNPDAQYDCGFDFDSKVIQEAAQDAVKLVNWLVSEGFTHRIFFSGSKGIHVVLPWQTTMMPARQDGGHCTKLFQQVLIKKLKLKTLDTNIHGVKRLWRCTNTVNAKTGMYKIEIDRSLLEHTATEGTEKLFALAQSPQPTTTPDLTPNEKLKSYFDKVVGKADEINKQQRADQEERAKISLKSIPPCLEQMIRSPLEVVNQAKKWRREVPSRNTLTVIAASLMKCHMGMNAEQMLTKVFTPTWRQRIAEISDSDDKTIERSTATAVRAVFDRNYLFACGMAVKHGCICKRSCPLYRDKEEKKDD